MTAPKKLITAVLVLASPLAALAQAAPPAVSIYGTLNVNTQYTEASGATNSAQSVKSRYAVSTDSSNIGVRGTLKVSEYVSALVQCETSANVDGINATGLLCGRNSRIGIGGNWGTLWYGNWDAPFKAAAYGTKADDPFMNTDVYGYQSIMGSPGFNYRSGGYSTASNTSITGFDVRASNSVGYWTPTYEGLSAKFQVAVNEFKNATGNQNPDLFGAVVNWNYALGPGSISLLAAYEQHDDAFALVTVNGAAGANFGSTAPNTAGTAAAPISSKDTAWRVGAGYELKSSAGFTTLGVLVDELTLEQKGAATGAVQEYKRLAWQVALKHKFDPTPVEIRARYSMADEGDCKLVGGGACSTTDYGASMLAVGVAYYFTPAFQGYVHFAQITNDDQAQYTFTIGGSPAVAGATPRGADPIAVGLGLRYAF